MYICIYMYMHMYINKEIYMPSAPPYASTSSDTSRQVYIYLPVYIYMFTYARRMGQPTQRATNYTARSNIDTAQIFLYANGQRPNRAMIRQRLRRRQRRGEPHTEHGLGVLLAKFCMYMYVYIYKYTCIYIYV